MIKKIINNTSLKVNIAFSFLSSGWSSMLSLIFVPIYINYIGPEAFGLIGIFTSLQVVLSLLDSGLSTTLNKEIASLSVLPNTQVQIRNLVKTLGNIYWGLALIAGLIALGLAPLIAKYWVNSNNLSVSTITISFILLSVSLIFQLPIGFYSGGMIGLKRQVPLNLINMFFGTLKSAGVILVLIYISNSIEVFFLWSLFINLLQALTLKYILWYYLPKTDSKPIFDSNEFKRVFRFASGIIGISLTAIFLTQIDKIILSKMLTLEQFGYYTISCSLSLTIYQLIGPIVQSYFPRFSNLISIENTEELKKIYHQGCQLVSMIVLPASFILIFFSKNLIFIWTNNQITTNNTMTITAIYAFGTGLNAIMNLPYYLTLSYGWTRLGFYQNLALIIVIVPLTIILASSYGAIGGAISWSIVNLLYFIFMPFIIHQKILKGQALIWYLNDTLKPLFISLIIIFASKYLLQNILLSRWYELIYIVLVYLITISIILPFSSKLIGPFFILVNKKFK